MELRSGKDGDFLVGYAAVFGSLSDDLGGFKEIIHECAFDATLRDGGNVAARIQHQGGLSTIGTTDAGTLKLSVDSVGLKYRVRLPDTSAGRDILELVRRGDIRKSSFAFSLREDGSGPAKRWDFNTADGTPLRELLRVNLHDVAPVCGPAYQATSVGVG